MEFITKEKKSRDESIDAIRGLAMILIIAGHTLTSGTVIRNIIFSFHVPLFFFITGTLFSVRKGKIKKTAIRTMKPYLFTALVIIVLSTLKSSIKLRAFDTTTLLEQCLSALFMSGWRTDFFGWTIPYIGAIWFLPALLWATIFLYIVLKYIPEGKWGGHCRSLQSLHCLL